MASFNIAYSLERKHEGNYVNNPLDKGGETYGGIARKIHPNWSGWKILDAYKEAIKPGKLKWNEYLPDLEPHVKAFYFDLWNKNNFGAIKNQDVANILYDWFINSGYLAFKTTNPETYGVNEILSRDFSKTIKSNADTIPAINTVDNTRLYNAIKKERINFYNDLVKRNPSQVVFLKGWLARINSFKDLTPVIIGGGLLLVIITFTIIVLQSR